MTASILIEVHIVTVATSVESIVNAMNFTFLTFIGQSFLISYIRTIHITRKPAYVESAAANNPTDLIKIKSMTRLTTAPATLDVAALVSYVFLTIYRMVDVQKFQKVKFNTGRFCLLIALLVLMCAICWIDTVALNVLNIILGCIIAVVVNRKIMKSILLTLKNKMKK